MSASTLATSEAAPAEVRAHSVNRRILEAAWGMPSFKAGFGIFVVLLMASAIVPLVSPISAAKMIVRDRFIPPLFFGDKWEWIHPLGTDQLGRDMLMRCLIGLQYSLMIGLVTVALIFAIGCGLGMFAGFKGKWWDLIIMRITDAQLSIPMIILAITILGVSRPSVPTIIIVLALSGWPLYARVARSAAVTERGKEYVLGLRVLGASDWRILHARGERPGDVIGRRACAHHQNLFRANRPGDDRRHRLSLGNHDRLAVAHGLLVRERPRSAAIGSVDQPTLVQFHEIATDRLARDAEGLGELGRAQHRRSRELSDDVPLASGLGEAITIRTAQAVRTSLEKNERLLLASHAYP